MSTTNKNSKTLLKRDIIKYLEILVSNEKFANLTGCIVADKKDNIYEIYDSCMPKSHIYIKTPSAKIPSLKSKL